MKLGPTTRSGTKRTVVGNKAEPRRRRRHRSWGWGPTTNLKMSDRKYRQRGYQDEPRERGPKGDRPPGAERTERAPGGRPLQDAAGPRPPHPTAPQAVCPRAPRGNPAPPP